MRADGARQKRSLPGLTSYDAEHPEEANDWRQVLGQHGNQRRCSSRARHHQSVVLGAVPGPEAEGGGGGEEDEVAAEAEEDGPHPDGERRLLAELREVEGGKEEGDEGGDHHHAVLVSKHVT